MDAILLEPTHFTLFKTTFDRSNYNGAITTGKVKFFIMRQLGLNFKAAF